MSVEWRTSEIGVYRIRESALKRAYVRRRGRIDASAIQLLRVFLSQHCTIGRGSRFRKVFFTVMWVVLNISCIPRIRGSEVCSGSCSKGISSSRAELRVKVGSDNVLNKRDVPPAESCRGNGAASLTWYGSGEFAEADGGHCISTPAVASPCVCA